MLILNERSLKEYDQPSLWLRGAYSKVQASNYYAALCMHHF